MRRYADAILSLERLLSEKSLLAARSVFSRKFLQKEAELSDTWGRLMPPWYAFYADQFKSERSRLHRLRDLDLVLRNLRGAPGKSNSRRDLERRIIDSGFPGSEAFFEVSILAAALSLGSVYIVDLYPDLASGRPEFSIRLTETPIFFEATCLKLKGKAYLPHSGPALTRVALTESRIKTKFEGKRGQLPRTFPGVLIVGNPGIDPIEDQDTLAEWIVSEAQQHFSGHSLIAIMVIWFNFLGNPALIRSAYLDCGTGAPSAEEREVIHAFEARFPLNSCRRPRLTL